MFLPVFADQPGKERQGKRENLNRKEGKSKKGRWKIENGRGKSFLFFPKPLKFVLNLPKWEFSKN